MMFKDLIEKHTHAMGLDKDLVHAIIKTESSENPFAMRFEPLWKYFFFPREYASKLNITYETENMLQACSYGLMQVMGSVARELGFSGELVKLLEPEINIKFGCLKLKKLFQRYGNEPDVIASYNAGSARKTASGFYVNQIYLNKVHTHLIELRKLKS